MGANNNNPAYDKAFTLNNARFYDNKPSAIRPFAHRINESFKTVCPNRDSIEEYSLPNIPPWIL